MSSEISERCVPRLGAGMKFRFDSVRQAWVLLGPERLFLPDEQAVEILKRIDGQQTLAAIIDALAGEFDAPREIIAIDVVAMVKGLVDRGAVRC